MLTAVFLVSHDGGMHVIAGEYHRNDRTDIAIVLGETDYVSDL